MADAVKTPRQRPSLLFLGAEEDLKSVPRFPGYDLYLHDWRKNQEKPRVIGIVSEDPAIIEGQIRRIREDGDLALIPLVVFSSAKPSFQARAAVDGVCPPVFAPEILQGVLKGWEPLRDEIDKFPPVPIHLSKREHTRLVLLRYLLLRGMEKLEPARDIRSRTGYCYPVAEMILQSADFDDCEADLRLLENRGLLRGEFTDVVHLCSDCRWFQLNFREVCPRCFKANLAEIKNIHHFRCGYVAAEAEFPEMRCPKCRRRLKHIGVDYDMPSVSFHCLCCNEIFEEPPVSCLCFRCGKDFPVEKAHKQIIRSYQLTPEGKRHAWDGFRESSIKSELGLMEFRVFEEICSVQTALAARSGKNLSLILVRTKDSGSMEGRTEENNSGSLSLGRLAAVMKRTLRTQDIMTVPPAGGVLALAADTSEEKALCIAERIRSAFTAGLEDFSAPLVTLSEYKEIPLEKALARLYTADCLTGKG